MLSRAAPVPADPEPCRSTKRKQRVGDSSVTLCFEGQRDPSVNLTCSLDKFAACPLRTYERALKSRQRECLLSPDQEEQVHEAFHGQPEAASHLQTLVLVGILTTLIPAGMV